MERIYNHILQITGNVIMVEAEGPKFAGFRRNRRGRDE